MDRYLNWLINNHKDVNIISIEQFGKIPTGTVHHFVKGSRGLPLKWQKPVITWVKNHLKL